VGEAISSTRQPAGHDELAQVDAITNRVLAEHHVLGAYVAIGKDGRLVLDRGYGFARLSPREPMRPGMTGCIGSVTKPFTAAAVLKLVEDGRLDINARLVEILSDLRPFPGLGIADPRFRDITVHHVLFHGGGFGDHWARSKAYDAAVERVKKRGENRHVYVGWEMAALNYRLAMSTPLKFAPGSDHSYSNFGFVTLRLVVERAAGMPYEAFCKRHVLHRMGIYGMNLDSKGEVYFDNESHRFNYYTESGRFEDIGGGVGVGGAGNWVASGADLIRFLTALSGSRGKRFFKEQTMDLMFGKPPQPFSKDTSRSWPGLGFGISQSPSGLSYFKNGGVAGAGTIIEHIADGNIDLAIWMNTTHRGEKIDIEEHGPNAMGHARRELHALFKALKSWPEIDLFER
jgi:N-acyl-D-amino-acid deacylase